MAPSFCGAKTPSDIQQVRHVCRICKRGPPVVADGVGVVGPARMWQHSMRQQQGGAQSFNLISTPLQRNHPASRASQALEQLTGTGSRLPCAASAGVHRRRYRRRRTNKTAVCQPAATDYAPLETDLSPRHFAQAQKEAATSLAAATQCFAAHATQQRPSAGSHLKALLLQQRALHCCTGVKDSLVALGRCS